MSKTVTQFGFGPLGLAVAGRLLANGYVINAWNRSPEKLIPLAEKGVIVKASAAEAIRSTETLICVLPDPASLQEALFDQDWAHDLEGRCVIHFGSVNPSRSQAIMDAFNAHQANYVEVAALGSVDDVFSGNLQLLIGSEPEDFQRVRQLLEELSDHVTYIGDVGSAVAIKLALQQLLASLFCGFSSSISLIREKGLSVDEFMDFIRRSPLYTPLFDQKLPRILGRDYSHPSLPGKHLVQDLKLFMEEAEDLGLNPYSVSSILDLINFSVARGAGDMDFTAVYDVLHPPKDDE